MSITLTAPHPVDRADEILTPEALAFIEKLHQNFAATRNERLTARGVRRGR
jgi:malate synthase